jgi:hypothetical protein
MTVRRDGIGKNEDSSKQENCLSRDQQPFCRSARSFFALTTIKRSYKLVYLKTFSVPIVQLPLISSLKWLEIESNSAI